MSRYAPRWAHWTAHRPEVVFLMSTYFFDPGQIQISPGAMVSLTEGQRAELLHRHLSGDWDWRQARNELAYLDAEVLFSEYLIHQEERSPICVWILTAADHSRTLMLLPEESPDRGRDALEVPGALFQRDVPPP